LELGLLRRRLHLRGSLALLALPHLPHVLDAVRAQLGGRRARAGGALGRLPRARPAEHVSRPVLRDSCFGARAAPARALLDVLRDVQLRGLTVAISSARELTPSLR